MITHVHFIFTLHKFSLRSALWTLPAWGQKRTMEQIRHPHSVNSVSYLAHRPCSQCAVGLNLGLPTCLGHFARVFDLLLIEVAWFELFSAAKFRWARCRLKSLGRVHIHTSHSHNSSSRLTLTLNTPEALTSLLSIERNLFNHFIWKSHNSLAELFYIITQVCIM
jgi:hypothetical protein